MKEKTHILYLIVRDEPGVMNRLTGLFSRRNFNIDTITVGKTNQQGLSRIVISLNADDETLEQLKKQLGKLIDVEKIGELNDKTAVVRELCLVTVAVKNQNARKEITSFANIFRANIVGVSKESLIIQLAGKPMQIEAFLDLVKKHGIKDISRTGVNAISRGNGK